jgi:hypothetical protein
MHGQVVHPRIPDVIHWEYGASGKLRALSGDRFNLTAITHRGHIHHPSDIHKACHLNQGRRGASAEGG